MDNIFIALGSNLNGPVEQLNQALKHLAGLPQTELVKHSAFYRNRPLGTVVQPDYVNAVAWIRSMLAPLDLLDKLQEIEQRQGRERNGVRWGARPIDLDILLYGDRQIKHPRLTVPHREMLNRDFVMIPLAEIAPPGLALSGAGLVEVLAAQFDSRALVRQAG